MVRPCQFEISDLARIICTGPEGHRLMALIFKFDESYDNQETLMVVGGWLMEESQWKQLESDWADCIDATNKAHRADQKITHFHATELNGFKKEFKNWDKPMSEEFTAKLAAILKQRPSLFLASAVNMQEMVKVFPQTVDTKLESALGLCVKQVMVSLGHVAKKNFTPDKLAMVYESGNLDDHANAAFKQMITDRKFAPRKSFTSLSFVTGKPAGLQAADLIAYESLKRILAVTVRTDAKLRWALRELLGAKHLGESAYIDRRALIALRGN